jgi:hypothetical protein
MYSAPCHITGYLNSHRRQGGEAPLTTPTATHRNASKITPAVPGPSWPEVMTLNVIPASIAPTGSTKIDSHFKIEPTLRVGRTVWRTGPTTVGPETTRMDPSNTAAAGPRSVNAQAATAATNPRHENADRDQGPDDALGTFDLGEPKRQATFEEDDRDSHRHDRSQEVAEYRRGIEHSQDRPDQDADAEQRENRRNTQPISEPTRQYCPDDERGHDKDRISQSVAPICAARGEPYPLV